MHFSLVDRVLEQSEHRIVTLKQVTRAEEYLLDHFTTYPVLPGVFMLESMVQAARILASRYEDPASRPFVLGRVRALKYGTFVRPGYAIRVEIDRTTSSVGPGASAGSGEMDFKGVVRLLDPAAPPGADTPTACTGRFSLRPVRVSAPALVGRPEPAPIG